MLKTILNSLGLYTEQQMAEADLNGYRTAQAKLNIIIDQERKNTKDVLAYAKQLELRIESIEADNIHLTEATADAIHEEQHALQDLELERSDHKKTQRRARETQKELEELVEQIRNKLTVKISEIDQLNATIDADVETIARLVQENEALEKALKQARSHKKKASSKPEQPKQDQ